MRCAGAPLPHGADAVVQIENTEQLPAGNGGQKRVRIVKVGCHHMMTIDAHHSCTILACRHLHCCACAQAAKGPGDDVRAVGSDIQAGEVVLAAGTVIGAAEVGLLATVGAHTVQVCIPAPLLGPDWDSLPCMLWEQCQAGAWSLLEHASANLEFLERMP